MVNTQQTQVPESSTQQNQSASNISLPPPPPPSFDPDHYGVGINSVITGPPPLRLNGEGSSTDTTVTFTAPSRAVLPEMAQPSRVPPPLFAGSAGNSPGASSGNEAVEAPRVDGDLPINVSTLGQESVQLPFQLATITMDCNEDILDKLMPLAREREIFILWALGTLSYVELLNRPDAPAANTILQGNFAINSLEGNIVLPKENEPNRASRVHVLVSGEDGRVRGGPVQKLISKSRVQVMISTMSQYGIQDWARQHYMATIDPNLPQFPDHKRTIMEYVNEVHKNTLKEINETNTFCWRCAQLKD